MGLGEGKSIDRIPFGLRFSLIDIIEHFLAFSSSMDHCFVAYGTALGGCRAVTGWLAEGNDL